MQLIDGKATAGNIKEEIRQKVALMVQQGQKAPHLAAILVGHDGGSESYVAHKINDCREVGFGSSLIRFEDDVTESSLLQAIEQLNNDPEIDGFIVQLPLPAHINVDRIIAAIDPSKDVDGFHPVNVGRMVLGMPCYLPATPHGVVQLLKRHGISTTGKHCVIVGRSNIVGSPLSILLAKNSEPGNCTVTLCHSRTPDLAYHTQQADILIAALGKPGFITASMVKKGAVVIDVGTSRVADAHKKSGFRLAGDVAFDEVAPICSAITPVPGGVGPMTRAMLLINTLKAAQKEVYAA